MNLIQQAEELKNVPDSALSQLSQGQGAVPPYLVMSEMKRREEMRKAYMSQKGGDPVQRKTVMEEMKERFNPSAPPSPDQQGQPGQPQQMAPNAPVRMAGGGLASVNNFVSRLGGGTPYPEEPDMVSPEVDPLSGLPLNSQQMPQMYANRSFTPDDAPLGIRDTASTQSQMDQRHGKVPSISAAMEQVRLLRGKSRLEGVAEALAAQEQQARGRKADIGQILMNLGLGMAASRRPDWAGAIGEGGINAMQGYAQQKHQNQMQADNFMKQRLGVLEAQQQSDDVATREAGELHRGDIAAHNTSVATIENSIRANNNADMTERMAQLLRQNNLDVAGVNNVGLDKRHAADAAAKAAEHAATLASNKEIAKMKIDAGEFHHASGDGQNNLTKQGALFSTVADHLDHQADVAEKYLSENMLKPDAAAPIKARIKALRAQADRHRMNGLNLMLKGQGLPQMQGARSLEDVLGSFEDRPPQGPPSPKQERRAAVKPPYTGPSANPADAGNFSVSDAVASSMGIRGLRQAVNPRKKPNVMIDPITRSVIDLPEDNQNLIRYQ